MKTKIEEIKTKAVPVLKQHGVTKAGIFGSYVRGEQTKKSDVDFLVEVPKDMGLLDFIGIKVDLEETLRKKIDLVEYHLIRPEIKKQVLTEQVRIL
jgi:uncharacterized protein